MKKGDGKAVCMMCGTDEDESVLIQVRHKGSQKWVCTGDLPALIHGG